MTRDLRYAVRTLLRSPGFAATALLSIALGIGASTAIFSLVDTVLLRPLAIANPEQLVSLAWKGNALANGWGTGYVMSYPMCRDLESAGAVFDGVFCRHPATVNFSTGDRHDPVRADVVTGSYFPVLAVRPALGRLIDPSDDVTPGAHPVAVLSYAHWQNRLGGASDIVGRTVLVNNYPMTVIGVAPEGFSGVDPHVPPDLWIPATMAVQAANIDGYWNRLLDRRAAWLHAFGRLKPGLTADDARVALRPWFQEVLDADTRREGFPVVSAEQRRDFLASILDVLPAPRGLSSVRGALERPLWTLMGGTVLLLLLAALNIAGLLVARGAARTRELTTRMAIGATSGNIVRQLLVESAVIAAAGGALGLVLAPAFSRALLSYLSPGGGLDAPIDLRALAFSVIAVVVTSMVSGVAPALQGGRITLAGSLNERARVGSPAAVRWRKAIVAGQLAFTLVLLIGAGLFVQTLLRLHDQAGFATRNLLMVSIDPPASGYAAADAERVMRDVLRRLNDLPVVERAAVANASLLTGAASMISVTLQADRRVASSRAVSRMRIGPGFFATLGTPIVAGRDFDERDVRPPGAAPVAYRSVIVNESFARRYFEGRSPVGARLGLGNRPDTPTSIEIIGVVKNFSRRTLREADLDQLFVPFWDQNSGDGAFYVKLRDDSEAAVSTLRTTIAEIDPALPVRLTAIDDQIDRALGTERMLASLSSGFGAIALLLAMVGLYGVMSFVVTQRTQEIGIRMALGATRASALWLVLRDAALMIVAGTAIALPAAWALRRLVEAELFGVSAFDVPTVVIASATLAAAALGAALLPGWRVASIHPTEAMRL